MPGRLFALFIFVSLFAILAGIAEALDHWIAPGGGSGTDCGRISDLAGKVEIRHPIMADEDPPVRAGLANRLRPGDIVSVPSGGRLEWKSGRNVVVTVGSDAGVRMEGVTTADFPGGISLNRLNFELLRGEARIQVRLNETRPESVLVRIGGNEILLIRGNLFVKATDQWHATVSDGWAEWRPHAGIPPRRIEAGRKIDVSGDSELSVSEVAELAERLPFSFELIRLALPPTPFLGDGDEQDGP
jgi:hypothetical protein